jgi:hypothetical protein
MTTYGRPRKPDPDGRRARQREYQNRSRLGKLIQGGRPDWQSNHHTGMAQLKALLGDPRPDRCQSCGTEGRTTLSLTATEGPNVYWGRIRRRGQVAPYLMSEDPGDYVWECYTCNMGRGRPTLMEVG